MQISFAIYSDITFIHFFYATAAFFFFMICSTAEIPTRTMPTRSETADDREKPLDHVQVCKHVAFKTGCNTEQTDQGCYDDRYNTENACIDKYRCRVKREDIRYDERCDRKTGCV